MKQYEEEGIQNCVNGRAEGFYRFRKYIDILFPDKVSIFFFFLANFIEKSDITISENTEH